jgi:SAM-dependent methyltransferase
MNTACNFCSTFTTFPLYSVPRSARGANVFLCSMCGLLESIYSAPSPAVKVRSLSSGADWGNVRHGKGLRLKSNLEFIMSAGICKPEMQILDIGSNRGSFCLHALNHWRPTSILAVEPDISLVDPYADQKNLTLITERFENLKIIPSSFDFVYCSHTLEHALSASEMLKTIHSILKPGGNVFIEVPSLSILEDNSNIEEFFIDKHSFHFYPKTLISFAQSIGFEIISTQNGSDKSHISLILRRGKNAPSLFPSESLRDTALQVQTLVSNYQSYLALNLKKLSVARTKVEFLLSRQKVVFWGGGRQLDSFIKHSGFNIKLIEGLIDEHLHGIIENVDGMPILSPDSLRSISPQLVIVFARNAYQEIAKKIRAYGIKNVIRFSDLL